MLNRAGAAGAFAACASVAFGVWVDGALRIRYQRSSYRKPNQCKHQKRKTALIAVFLILPRATRAAPQHFELLTWEDEDFSFQSTHHRNSRTVAYKITPHTRHHILDRLSTDSQGDVRRF
jgi:hypothetical protein